jgi:hypothetical protein
MLRKLAPVAILTAIALSGCGSQSLHGSRHDTTVAGVRALLHQMADGLAAGDVSDVCEGMITQAGRDELLRAASYRFLTCEQQMRAADGYLGPAGLQKMRAQVSNAPVVVRGNTAMASPNDPQNTQWFVFEAGQWYASSPHYQ